VSDDPAASGVERGAVVKSIDFDRVARYYDLCVHPDFDLSFWVEEARRHPGRRLELMCGTGRIALAILRASFPLTCVDYSAGLLSVLREKLSREGLTAELVNMDVRCLDLGASRYDWAFVGFHALAELAGEGDLIRALRRIANCLIDGGVFSCSLHNPVVRGPALDGQWRDFEPVPLPESDGRLEWRGRYRYERETGLVTGEQAYRELDASGREVAQVELPVRFRLFSAAEIEEAVQRCGFEVVSRWGDYDRSPCDPTSSPLLIYELRKR
jgi:SAM-dependent methyltransferase